MNINMTAWNKVCEEYPTPTTQGEADTAISVYLSSCEHTPSWIPSIEEWREMLEKSKSLVTKAGFRFSSKACVQALSGWFWRYHWRELDRELFKQYLSVMTSYCNSTISAVREGLWEEVLQDTEQNPEECFKPSPMLWRHLMNVTGKELP
jgi:hypothetical protein